MVEARKAKMARGNGGEVTPSQGWRGRMMVAVRERKRSGNGEPEKKGQTSKTEC